MTSRDMYTYRDAGALRLNASVEIAGYSVEARDGAIGKVESDLRHDSSYLVVDTGPWIFGKKVILPAGVIDASTPPTRRSSSTAPRTDQGLP